MERERALILLKGNLKNDNLQKHSLAVEAAMRGLAQYLEEDIDNWGLCGLLHDIDYEKSKGDSRVHSKMGAEMLEKLEVSKEICDAVLSHNEVHGVEPKTKMAQALFCIDPLTGLIVAATLVLPSRKISDLKTENILKRFKEKAFARGADREIILKSKEYFNLPLEKFVDIVLSSMQRISEQLGL